VGTKGLPFTGGLEIIMEEIGSRLVSDGYEVDVFVRQKYMPDEWLPYYRGLWRILTPGLRSKHFDAISHTLTAMFKIVSGNYSVVYINAIGLSVLGFIPRLFGIKVITQIHGLD